MPFAAVLVPLWSYFVVARAVERQPSSQWSGSKVRVMMCGRTCILGHPHLFHRAVNATHFLALGRSDLDPSCACGVHQTEPSPHPPSALSPSGPPTICWTDLRDADALVMRVRTLISMPLLVSTAVSGREELIDYTRTRRLTFDLCLCFSGARWKRM